MTRVGTSTPPAPSADVIARANKVKELLGTLSVPFTASDVPPDLIRPPERKQIEIRERTRTGGARPVLDPMSFEVLNRIVLAKSKHLQRELKRHFEFVGATVEAVPTPTGRWYFRLTDPTGQNLDVLFGSGLQTEAKIFMHAHAGRGYYQEVLSPEASLELAQLMLGAKLTPPQKNDDDDNDFEIADGEEAPEEAERQKIEALRQEYLKEANAFLRQMVKRAPLKIPPLLREIARKSADQIGEADLDRMIGTIANEPIMLRAFSLDAYDGRTLRMVRSDADGRVSFIELMIQEYEDREPGVLLRVSVPPEEAPEPEYRTDLENDRKITEDLDDEYLTPYFEVTKTSLGLALLRYATQVAANPPIELDETHELLRRVDPNAKPEQVDEPEPEPEVEKKDDPNRPLTVAEKRAYRKAVRWMAEHWDDMSRTRWITQDGLPLDYMKRYAGDSANRALPGMGDIFTVFNKNPRFYDLIPNDGYAITKAHIDQAIAEFTPKNE